MRTLNLGILAHVDAGKTTLTERLLYAAGVIREVGSVDHGTTQTDSLALERQRGITIKSGVVSFAIDDVAVNLIDTPGHPDFIAEVERALSVLDGAVLVISAVEGVQPQTRTLLRALRRLQVPTLLFVNKIDRSGAGVDRVLEAVRSRLGAPVVAMGSVDRLGTRAARFLPFGADDHTFRANLIDALAEHSDSILAAYVHGERIPYDRLRDELAAQTQRMLVHPVFFGSAITGAGVDSLISGIAHLLPAADHDADGPVSGRVFKIEPGVAGEKIAYVRMYSGTVHLRDRLPFHGRGEPKVTAINVFENGGPVRRDSVAAGQIGKIWGLAEGRIGDYFGAARPSSQDHYFAPPTLETVVTPRDPRDRAALRAALAQLSEQDPLINVRQDDARQEISVSLYGEVQKEIIQATLADEFDIHIAFRETTTICIERPIGTGEAIEILNTESNPFHATMGLRVALAPMGSGVEFRSRADPRTLPLYIYKNVDNFADIMGQHVRRTLAEGLFGWQVTDCTVTMTECDYSLADGPPAKRGPMPTPADFRNLTPMVLMDALRRAGTRVYEPIHRFHLEIPADTIGSVLSALPRLRAVPGVPATRASWCTLDGDVPAERVHQLRQQLLKLTGGEGAVECAFDRYEPVRGRAPARPRSGPNPLNRKEYLLHVTRRGI